MFLLITRSAVRARLPEPSKSQSGRNYRGVNTLGFFVSGTTRHEAQGRVSSGAYVDLLAGHGDALDQEAEVAPGQRVVAGQEHLLEGLLEPLDVRGCVEVGRGPDGDDLAEGGSSSVSGETA